MRDGRLSVEQGAGKMTMLEFTGLPMSEDK